MIPNEETLDLLWLYCSISVVQTRGGHDCEFCHVSAVPRYFERNGQRLFLGTSEIRIFSQTGTIYAAPTLIYHYVAAHHYKPPDEFLEALRKGPRPPSKEYFDTLARLNLEWSRTSRGPVKDRVLLHPDAGPDGRNYLTRIGTLADIERMGLKLEEGLIVHFYQPDTNRETFRDDLLFEGRVHLDPERNQWYAMIDPESYRRES
jgi:hypothetical protein